MKSRKMLAVVLGIVGCGDVTCPSSHEVDIGPQPDQMLIDQDEGCHEVQIGEYTIPRGSRACVADDGFVCSFDVTLKDGTLGCCTTEDVIPEQADGWIQQWHSCGGGK